MNENQIFYEFDAQLYKLEGKLPWTVFYIPFSIKEHFDTFGRVEIFVYIDGYQFEGILLPSRKGHFMVFNKDIQKVIPKVIGDWIHVKFSRNVEPTPLFVPSLIINKLKYDPKLLDAFYELPLYIKKDVIHHIMEAKKEDTQLKRIDMLIKKLRNTN